jgi:dTDP-4-amino-4,6-dideoxygalactose transaminase
MSESRPALLGGNPTRPEGPPAWPRADADMQAAIQHAMSTGAWGQYHGEHVCALEAELAAFHTLPHAITCASGTLAVEAALRAVRVEPGDEVIVAAYEYESTFLTLHALGAKPVLVDVHAHNWQLDETQLATAISPRTKAVICSHLHGGLVNMPGVMDFARANELKVIEDAAQAPGARIAGKYAGTWGDVGTLSFGGSKLLSAGRGGALLFNDAQLHQRAKTWLHRGLQQWAPLSELQAAVLRPQLRKLNAHTANRLANVRFLANAVKSRTLGLQPLAALGDADTQAFYKVGFQYDAHAFGISRELFVKALRAEGIAFDAGFKALHVGRSPSRFRAVGELPHATAAHHNCVMLHHPVLAGVTSDIQQVADALAKVYLAGIAGLWANFVSPPQ